MKDNQKCNERNKGYVRYIYVHLLMIIEFIY